MKRIKHILLTLLLAAFTVGVVTGCNTTRGFGEDVESVGEDISN